MKTFDNSKEEKLYNFTQKLKDLKGKFDEVQDHKEEKVVSNEMNSIAK